MTDSIIGRSTSLRWLISGIMPTDPVIIGPVVANIDEELLPEINDDCGIFRRCDSGGDGLSGY